MDLSAVARPKSGGAHSSLKEVNFVLKRRMLWVEFDIVNRLKLGNWALVIMTCSRWG